jgi:hypothetical protein
MGKIFLKINMEGISNDLTTYYWKDISSFRYQLKLKSVPQKGGGYITIVDYTNLLLFDKKNQACGSIRIEMTGWSKTTAEIRLAIFSVTDGCGIKDLGNEEDIRDVLKN